MSEAMRDLIRTWDGEAVVSRFDEAAGAWVFIALHDTTLGMPVGGTRMKPYATPEDGLRDAMRLARGMTYKWAAIDFPFGGGKAVLAVPAGLEGEEREGLLVRYARLVDSLNGAFATGVDLGTTPEDMRLMAGHCRYVMGQVGAGAESRSLDPGPYTALGVLRGTGVAVRHGLGLEDLSGVRVLIQGVGDVGLPLARLLAEAGAELALADIDEGRARSLAGELGASVVAAADAYDAECDVFAPCAVGAVLSAETIPRLRCRVVAGSANNQLATDEDAERLHERGILYAPDYIINAGGAVAFGLIHQRVRSEAILRERVSAIGDTLDEILAESEERGESPVHGARRRARRALESGAGEPAGTAAGNPG